MNPTPIDLKINWSLYEGPGSFSIPSLSFPRRRESRNVLLKKLDARLRGHDGKNSPTPQLFVICY
jgi:hypothetical protein